MANESGSDENLCFFNTRIGEEGSPEREQADGVMDAIVKPAAKELGMECVRADQLPDPGQITTQIIDRIVGAKIVVADLTGGNPNVYYELAVPPAPLCRWPFPPRPASVSHSTSPAPRGSESEEDAPRIIDP